MTASNTTSVFRRDGVLRIVYCHLHGEPARDSHILHTHYVTGQQAEVLVEHGDIRRLGPRCNKPAGYTLQNPVGGVTVHYGHDSGFRMDSETCEYRSFREATVIGSTKEVRFHHVFIDGHWKVIYRTPEGWKMKVLALALRHRPKRKKGRAVNPAPLRRRFLARKSGISITIYGDYAIRPSIIFTTAEYVKRPHEECLRENEPLHHRIRFKRQELAQDEINPDILATSGHIARRYSEQKWVRIPAMKVSERGHLLRTSEIERVYH